MKNIIFYFTGTGNSLALARKIASKIGDTSVVPIAEATKEVNFELPYERIGFVFPVYYYFMPSIVENFIRKLNLNQSQYIFGVATYGGQCGKALTQLERCVSKQGGALDAGFSVRMPGNYIVKYGAFPKIIQKLLLKWEKRRVGAISKSVYNKGSTPIPKGDFIARALSGSVKKTIAGFGESAKNFSENGNCNGCLTCSKICPVGNISIKNRKPVWGNQCEQCMVCIQWCPLQAVEYGEETAKRKRYNHPDVKLSDLVMDKNAD